MDEMCQIKLSRLYGTLLVCLYTIGTKGVPFCTPPTEIPGYDQQSFKTLCDYPEFCFCHDPFGKIHCSCKNQVVQNIILRSEGSCSIPIDATSITVDNCNKVTVIQDSFKGLRGLRNIELTNIKEVSIQSYGFHWNETLDNPYGLNINLTNVTIPDVPEFAFKGRIDTITFDNSYVGMIRSFAFSSLIGSDSIVFKNSNLPNIEAQALKKFTLNKLLILNSRINVIPGRFVVEVYVDNLFKIESTFVDIIKTLAFKKINAKETMLVNSRIRTLESEAFEIQTRGDVTIQSNVFDNLNNYALRGISVDKFGNSNSGLVNSVKPKFKFQNNTIVNFEEKSLYINRTGFDVIISKVMIDDVCTCDILSLWKERIEVEKNPKKKSENSQELFWCHLDDKKELDYEYVSGKVFYESHCTILISGIYFFVIIITATSLSLLVLIVLIVCYVRYRKKWKSVPTSENNHQNAQNNKSKNKFLGMMKNDKHPKAKNKNRSEIIKPESAKAIIVPDGRTYRETEFHVIVEKAEPLDDAYIPYTVTRDRSHSQIN